MQGDKMKERVCKYCYKSYNSDDSSADKNVWGFCSGKCERDYEKEERFLETRRMERWNS